MADAILVSLAKATATALQTAFDASAFDFGRLEITWDFEGREKDFDPKEGTVYVRATVPQKYDRIERSDRDTLQYVATVDIWVRSALGVADQLNDQTISRDELSRMVRLTEQIHEYFEGTLSEARLTLADHGLIAEWIDERPGEGRSELFGAYSAKDLKDFRQFWGLCREVFELTAGTA